MTRISPSLYPDRQKPHQATTQEPRLEFGAVTSVKGNQCAPTEGTPHTPHIGVYPQPFETVFPDPDDVDVWEDYRDATKSFLTAINRVLFAIVAAGIGTLLWVNLIN